MSTFSRQTTKKCYNPPMITDSEKEAVNNLVQSWKESSGKIRGEIILDHIRYIEEKEGSAGLEKLKEKLTGIGVDIDFNNINPTDWISVNVSFLIIIIAKDLFRWSDEDVFAMGLFTPRFPLGLRILVQTVMIPEKLFRELPVYWRNIFNFGYLNPFDYNEDLQRAKISITEFQSPHPIINEYLKGFIKGLVDFMLKEKDISVEQTKSTHKGEDGDEYVIYWE